jgi:large subunit ribosomal protein L10
MQRGCAMNRQQKEDLVQVLHQEFADAHASFLVDYQGLTVNSLQDLRKKLREHQGIFKVAKARLMKRAVDGQQGSDAFASSLHGQVALVFAENDVPAVAKALHAFALANEKLKLLGGFMDARAINAAGVVRLASLPSREVLLGQVCGTMKAPINNFVGVLNMLIVRLLFVLKEISEKKAANG